jgi:hypothetical protein
MDRDQIKEHLTFAAELGVAGVSRDLAWRTRADPGVRPSGQTSGSDPGLTLGTQDSPTEAPLTFSKNAAEALLAIRTDLGEDC